MVSVSNLRTRYQYQKHASTYMCVCVCVSTLQESHEWREMAEGAWRLWLSPAGPAVPLGLVDDPPYTRQLEPLHGAVRAAMMDAVAQVADTHTHTHTHTQARPSLQSLLVCVLKKRQERRARWQHLCACVCVCTGAGASRRAAPLAPRRGSNPRSAALRRASHQAHSAACVLRPTHTP